MLKQLSLVVILGVALVTGSAAQQSSIDLPGAVAFSNNVRATANVVYKRADGWEGRLDVYTQRGTTPTPTVMFFHGGGWTQGAKEGGVYGLLPWLAMGYSVVNVEYRLTNVALAPAAIEDARCALRWVFANAKEYNFDTAKIITTGQSAGGHLALMTGMVPTMAGFDRSCLTNQEPKVAGIVNWYGITDVADLLDAPGKDPFPWTTTRPYAVQWLGNQPNREEIAKAASPMTYVRAGLPPIISVQGDADPTVPYRHNVQLHAALAKAGVRNEFITIPKGLHGGFPLDQQQRAFAAIQAFLNANGLAPSKAPATVAAAQ